MGLAHVAGVLVLLAAGIGCSMQSESASDSLVPADNVCSGATCVSFESAAAQLGWAYFELTRVPEGFALSSRIVQADPPASGAPGGENFSIAQTYSFQESQTVPGIMVWQSRPFEGSEFAIQPASDACGELEESAFGPVYLVEGVISVSADPESQVVNVCSDKSAGFEAAHSLAAARDGILVELLAFPESGITKEAVLLMLDSLLPASGESQGQ